MKSAKELFNQMKSVLVVKSATYTHSMEVKTSDFIVETIPTFSVNISLDIVLKNPSDYLKYILFS